MMTITTMALVVKEGMGMVPTHRLAGAADRSATESVVGDRPLWRIRQRAPDPWLGPSPGVRL